MMRSLLRLAALCILVSVCSLSAHGQVTTATLLGSVTDPSGAVIAKAQVQLRNDATGLQISATTDDRGEFTVSFIPVGRFTLTVQYSGFREYVQKDLDLVAGQKLRLNIRLEVGPRAEAVTVTGEAPLVNSVSSEQLGTLSNVQIRELPLSRRDWTHILSVNTGVSKAGLSGVSLNGLPPAAFNLTIDGTNATSDPEINSLGMYQGFNTINAISAEAIQEVSTVKGIATAEFGATMSGNVNITSKGGTNAFHGTLFENNALEDYAARNRFVSSLPNSVFNQFGGSLGGPIKKDKLFFFFAYEGVRDRSFRLVNDDVPTPEYLAQILAANPIYTDWAALWPAPTESYDPGDIRAEYTGTGTRLADDNHLTARADWNLTASNRFTFRYTHGRPNQTNPRVVAVNQRVYNGTEDGGTANFVHSASTWIAETRVGYNRVSVLRLDALYNLHLANIRGDATDVDTGDGELFFKEGSTTSVEEVIAMNRGRHAIKFGGIFVRQLAGRNNLDTPEIRYDSFDELVANTPTRISKMTFGVEDFQLHAYQIGGFIQDNFRVRPRLMLNVGLRYDYFTVPKERDNRIFNRDGQGFGALRSPDEMYNANRAGFSPRLGFAWSVDEQSKTVLRGGAGMFINAHPIFGGPIETVMTAVNVPFRVVLSGDDAAALDLKYPIVYADALAKIKTFSSSWSTTAIDPYFPQPYSMQWHFGVERQLTKSMAMELAYVGNHGVHLNTVRDMNKPDPVTGDRPVGGFGQFRYYDASNSANYHGLQASLRRRFANGLSFSGNYTWAKNLAYGSGDLQLEDRPQDNNNLRAEYGPTNWDIHHRFTADFVYELPFARFTSSHSTASKLLLGGWQISGVFTAQTGLPVNLYDDDSSYPNTRPDLVPGVNPYLDYTSSPDWQYLNPLAFQKVPLGEEDAPLRYGNLGRNALRAPGLWNIDLSVAKAFSITERIKLQLRADMFNAFNHPNPSGLIVRTDKLEFEDGVFSGTFGQLKDVSSRTMQIGAKLTF